MSYEIIVSRFHWLKLSNEQRIVMRDAFQVPKSGGVEMQNGVITSDGSNERDLSAINLESLQKFTDSKSTSFQELFDLAVAKVDEILAQKKQAEEDERNNTNADERNRKLAEMVESTLLTIDTLPDDAKMRIYYKLSLQFAPMEEKEQPDVKETSTAKKGKKAVNKPSAEGAGSGGSTPEKDG